MVSWSVQDAKARFCELLETCLSEGPQVVTKRGVETAVLVSIHEWRRIQAASRPGLRELLLTNFARVGLNIPARGLVRRRKGGPLG